MLPRGMSNFPLSRVDDKNVGWVLSREGRAWVKMPKFNVFSRNANTINLKIYPTHDGICKFEKKFTKHSGEG